MKKKNISFLKILDLAFPLNISYYTLLSFSGKLNLYPLLNMMENIP